MQAKRSRTNHSHSIKPEHLTQQPSTQIDAMGKYSITKRRHSHQSKILRSKQEESFTVRKFEHVNSTTRLKHRTTTTTTSSSTATTTMATSSTFRPLAASTPYDIEQSNALNDGSPHSWMRTQRLFLTPPVFSSTPKSTRRPNNNSHGRSNSSFKQRFLLESHPPLPIISQRRLQFTPKTQSFVRYAHDDSKRLNIQNVKIWLL